MIFSFNFSTICQVKNDLKKYEHNKASVLDLFGDPYGNRTHDFAVRGRRLNRLTKGPCFQVFLC